MKFITSPKELTIVLDRKEQIAAFKAKIVVKKAEIKDLRWCDKFAEWHRWEVRLPGSSIPQRLIAGSYWTESGWDFLYLRHPVGVKAPTVSDVLVIELEGHSKFERIVISATKPDFERLNKWRGSK